MVKEAQEQYIERILGTGIEMQWNSTLLNTHTHKDRAADLLSQSQTSFPVVSVVAITGSFTAPHLCVAHFNACVCVRARVCAKGDDV